MPITTHGDIELGLTADTFAPPRRAAVHPIGSGCRPESISHGCGGGRETAVAAYGGGKAGPRWWTRERELQARRLRGPREVVRVELGIHQAGPRAEHAGVPCDHAARLYEEDAERWDGLS